MSESMAILGGDSEIQDEEELEELEEENNSSAEL